jgi:hypothetical protein
MASDERRSERANVILAAVIEHAHGRVPVRIKNLSQHGALVIGDGLPVGETLITFKCNGQSLDGWVAWSQEGRAGIQFGSPNNPDTLTNRERRPGISITKDNRDIDFRRPGFRGNQLSEGERKIVEEWTKQSQDARQH